MVGHRQLFNGLGHLKARQGEGGTLCLMPSPPGRRGVEGQDHHNGGDLTIRLHLEHLVRTAEP
jgi:hypothetical protein